LFTEPTCARFGVPAMALVVLTRWLANKIDTDDERVVLTGSFGDPEARRRREAWEHRMALRR